MADKKKVELIGKRRGHSTRKFKIVIDARGISKTTGRYNRGLLNYLPDFDSRNEYHVLINPDDQGSWKPLAQNFYLHIVPYTHYSFAEQFGFARYLRKIKPDLVHFMMPQQPLLYFGKRVTSILDLTLVRFQNLDKNKLVYTVQQKIFTRLVKNVAKRSKHIITISKFVKDDIAAFARIPKQKITVTYPSAEPLASKASKPKLNLSDKKFLLYTGNAFPHKNLERLVEAFALFRADSPDYHLVFVGKEEFFYRQLQQKVKELGYENIHFLGFIPDEQLVWLYQHAKAYVFPSLSEGFGLPGLEAMVYDLPVAASNSSCLPEIYGDAAEYFDPEDINAIAKVLQKVTTNKKLRTKLIKNGKKQLLEYSWEDMAEQTQAVYMRVLK